jgi:hypothetical protein
MMLMRDCRLTPGSVKSDDLIPCSWVPHKWTPSVPSLKARAKPAPPLSAVHSPSPVLSVDLEQVALSSTIARRQTLAIQALASHGKGKLLFLLLSLIVFIFNGQLKQTIFCSFFSNSGNTSLSPISSIVEFPQLLSL